MINVCYLVDAPFLGGAERYIQLIAARLDREEFRPSVVMKTPDDAGSNLKTWRSEMEALDIPVRSVPMNLPFNPYHAVGIHAAVAGFNPHVVHVNMPGPYSGQTGLLVPLGRMSGALGVVVTEHLPMVGRLWKRRLVKRISFKWVDRVLTVCHANVPYLTGNQDVPPEKVMVVHNALELEYGTGDRESDANVRLEYGLPADIPVVVFVGNLLEHKGLHRAIEVLSEMPSTPWHLAVIGDGPDRGLSENILEAGNLQHRATFLGRVPSADVAKILGACDVLTLPSSMEGMPYVILEAMASGLPVVSTDVFGIPEMVVDGETGFLAGPDDLAALGRAFAALLNDGELRKTMGRRGRERFEAHFTMDKQISRIQGLYKTLANAGATGGEGGP